ncbi:NADH dehydrogenase iron-sulfur protein [Striga asiatica]|uniref:NADH dehydrogenase iron-sulfur protein n=1 Tax=Striga asiatica TaxID=4170 RepID=A0A5A7PH67_STRAF|nr:NADH dehydrogenase iron-sulfur protein [Striga asiatica]
MSYENGSMTEQEEGSSKGKEARTEIVPQDELIEISLVEGEPEKVTKIPRAENGRADLLSKVGASLVDCRSRSVTLMQMGSSILEGVMELEEKEDWRSPILGWLAQADLGQQDVRGDKLGRRALRFFVQEVPKEKEEGKKSIPMVNKELAGEGAQNAEARSESSEKRRKTPRVEANRRRCRDGLFAET